MAKATPARAAKPRGDDSVIDVGGKMPGDIARAGGLILDDVREDEQFIVAAGRAVLDFLNQVGSFSRRASTIEREARETLQHAKELKAPTSGDQDAGVQRLILKANAQRKEAEAHWTITAAVSQLHKRLTGARKRATEPLEQAATIGNNLHNAWTDGEARRARAEQDRIDREARETQERIRNEELAALEQQAIAAEEAAPDLSEREQCFVDLYFSGTTRGDGMQSARRAGFKSPLRDAARLLTLAKITKAIEAKRAAQALRDQAAAVQRQPLDPVHVDEVRADVQKVGTERTTWSGEMLNERALIDACVQGGHGIPTDILMVNPAKLNEYARSLHELLDRWPGVRAKKTTTVI